MKKFRKRQESQKKVLVLQKLGQCAAAKHSDFCMY